MDWIKKIALVSALVGVVCVVASCRISMGLAPISSIDYSKVKTITIAEFPNRAEYVYAPMTTEFNQKLKDMFIQKAAGSVCSPMLRHAPYSPFNN